MVADWIMAKAEGYGCKPKAVPLDETVTPGTTIKGFPTLSFRMDPSEAAISDAPTGTDPWTASMRYTLKQGCIDAGVQIYFETPAVQLIREDKGRVTGVIAGAEGAYTKFVGQKGIILCSGDHAAGGNGCGTSKGLKFYIFNDIILNLNLDMHNISADRIAYFTYSVRSIQGSNITRIHKMIHNLL
jgi:hypothetical protein